MDQSRSTLTIPYNFIPRPYQLEVFRAMDGEAGKPETKKRRALLRWHRRAGKDKACWCFLLKEAAQVPGNYFYIFPTSEEARRVIWETVDKDGFKLLDHMPKEYIKRISNQEMSMTLANNSVIRVLGLDKNPDSIRGVSCKGVVFSEFAYSDPNSYKTMIPSLRESEGWAIFNSTPNGRNHYYELWQNVVNSERWFTSILQTYWADKPGYSGLIKPEEFSSIIQEEGLTEEEAEREYGVSFNSGMQGAFYSDQIDHAYSEGRVSSFLYDENTPVDTFWDLGVDDSTAVWFRQKIGNKLVFIDYYEDSGKDITHYIKVLETKGYSYGTHYLPHDAQQRSLQTGSSTADMFEYICGQQGINNRVHVLERLPVQDGINAVRARFSRYCFDTSTCAAGLKKLELYHRRFDKRRKVYLKEPVHDSNSHCADALRMEAISEDIRNDGFFKQNQIKVTWSGVEDW